MNNDWMITILPVENDLCRHSGFMSLIVRVTKQYKIKNRMLAMKDIWRILQQHDLPSLRIVIKVGSLSMCVQVVDGRLWLSKNSSPF